MPDPFSAVIVEPGDTLRKIAERELGSARAWTIIAHMNHLRDAEQCARIQPGDILVTGGMRPVPIHRDRFWDL